MQYWSQTSPPIVVVLVVMFVVIVVLGSLELELEPSTLSPLLDSPLLLDAVLAAPPLLEPSLPTVSSPAPLLSGLAVLLAVDAALVVNDVPKEVSSRVSVEHAIDHESATAIPTRDDVPTIARASPIPSALDLEIPRVEERSQ